MLTVSENWQERICVVAAEGEVDAHTAHSLREALARAIASGSRQVVADLSMVSFIDSSGLGVLVGNLKELIARQGDLRVVVTQERVTRVFEVTGLDTVFGLHPSVEAAIAAFMSQPDPVVRGTSSAAG